MKTNYNKTIYACFIGYIVQAIINNFIPLLFLTFQRTYGIPLTKITLLVTINFGIQMLVDLLSMIFVDKIGYRASIIIAHLAATIGLLSLTILPDMLSDPFLGLLISVTIYAIGGGLLEALVSPIMDACPTDNKEKSMSLLHSFYCWGHVGVVLLSSIIFKVFGIENWKFMAIFWAIIPFLNTFLFSIVPIASLIEEGETGFTIKELFSIRLFWVFMFMMVCAGASEQAVSQWASTFAEKGLGVSKAIGDLAGPMTFAILMGTSRALYGKYGEKINLNKFMIYSTILCILSYLTIILIPIPIFGLIGCAICGLSVGIMWPGTFSLASSAIRRGGTPMFAFMALAGDLGCLSGPTLVGIVSSRFNDDLRMGILAAIIFPSLLLVRVVRKKGALG